MTGKRKLTDGILNGLTYLSSGIAVIILIMVVQFILARGWGGVNIELLTKPYWSGNHTIEFPQFKTGQFDKPESLGDEIAFSSKLGIGLSDGLDAYKEHQVVVEYIDPDSPLQRGIVSTAGVDLGKELGLVEGANIVNLMLIDTQGDLVNVGAQRKSTAEDTVIAMDQVSQIRKLYFKTEGGGIRGSLIATLYLIGLSLAIALPIGISAAIYLNEYAKTNRITRAMRSSIELLSGVPSIIFGLMGVSVLFPITQLMGIQTVSIILGALTMAVVLLPLIIRQTEESLKVVPSDLRYASLSLGATQTQTIFKVVLPSALPGILTASLLSISRIIGESAALIYTMGTFISDKPQLDQGATTLAVQIWSLMSGEQPNFELSSTISIIILMIVLSLNITVKLISYRLNKKWSVS